jgi:aminoglycoside/choline kinase family phosphotransferase
LSADEEPYEPPVYDIEAMLVEVELVNDWYAPAIARVTPPSGARMQFLAIWREVLAPILADPARALFYYNPQSRPRRQGPKLMVHLF